MRLSLVRHDPKNSQLEEELFRSYQKVGLSLAAQRDFAGAEANLRAALDVVQQLPNEKLDAQTNDELAGGYYSLALAQQSYDPSSALASYRKAASIRQSAIAANPGRNAALKTHLAADYDGIAQITAAQGHIDAAIETAQNVVNLLEEQSKTEPNNADLRKYLADSYYSLGWYLEQKNELALALASDRKAQSIYEALSNADQSNAFVARWLAYSETNIGSVLSAQRQPQAAVRVLAHSIALLQRLAVNAPNDHFVLEGLADACANMGGAYTVLAKRGRANMAIGYWRDARSYYRKSLDIWLDLSSHSTLSKEDSQKPEIIRNSISECDTALTRLGFSNPVGTQALGER
jgi:tetratricopeptide (TPR) repeat protein